MKRTYHMSMSSDGVGAYVAKVEDGKIFWLEGYILTDRHSESPLVERDGYIPDIWAFAPDIAELLEGRHILEVSTAKFFSADLFMQERIIVEFIDAVIYDTKRGIE